MANTAIRTVAIFNSSDHTVEMLAAPNHRSTPELPGRLTTTHKDHLNSLVGHDTGALEIVGKPHDLQAIADAVTRAIERRASAGPRIVGQPRD